MPSYLESNDHEQARLTRLLTTLDAAQLELPLNAQWRVADALLHLAFWDFYATEMLRLWQREGFQPLTEPYELVNAAFLPFSTALPHTATLALVAQAAHIADATVAATPAALVATIEAHDMADYLLRAKHRKHHLDQIEALLGGACCA